jgi:hypothetical protein
MLKIERRSFLLGALTTPFIIRLPKTLMKIKANLVLGPKIVYSNRGYITSSRLEVEKPFPPEYLALSSNKQRKKFRRAAEKAGLCTYSGTGCIEIITTRSTLITKHEIYPGNTSKVEELIIPHKIELVPNIADPREVWLRWEKKDA